MGKTFAHSPRHKAEGDTIKWQHTVINNNKHIHIQSGKLQKLKLPEEFVEIELNKCMLIDQSNKHRKNEAFLIQT